MKPTRLLLAAAFFLAACSAPTTGHVASPVRINTPTPSANAAESMAVDLRIRLDLLLGEHVMLVAKESAAAVNHNEEYAGYASFLNTNGGGLVDVFRSAYGDAAGDQLKQAWDKQNSFLVNYSIGVVAHDDTKSNAAMTALQNESVPQLAGLLNSLSQLPKNSAALLLTQRATETKAFIDDQLAQSYSKFYPDLHKAYADSSHIGDMLATRIAQKFPDKFPGDPSSNAADVRVALNLLLQENAYLATMTTDAAVSGRSADQSAGSGALSVNEGMLVTLLGGLSGEASGTQFGQVWGARDLDLVAYASNGGAAARQRLTDTFPTRFYPMAPAAGDTPRNQVVATLKVIDDQRAKNYSSLAGDDRAAAAAMQPLADRID